MVFHSEILCPNFITTSLLSRPENNPHALKLPNPWQHINRTRTGNYDSSGNYCRTSDENSLQGKSSEISDGQNTADYLATLIQSDSLWPRCTLVTRSTTDENWQRQFDGLALFPQDQAIAGGAR